MNDKTVQIVDQSYGVVATAQVAETDGSFAGSIDLHSMPEDLLRRFEAYEAIINGQMFSLLDEMEEQISELPLMALFPESEEILIEDLQIYPSDRRISFRVAPKRAQHNGHHTYSNPLLDMPRPQAEPQNPA